MKEHVNYLEFYIFQILKEEDVCHLKLDASDDFFNNAECGRDMSSHWGWHSAAQDKSYSHIDLRVIGIEVIAFRNE